MTERKKKLLSLLVSSFVIFNLTGCSTISRRNNAVNEIVYSGSISLDAVKNLYIVEISDLKNEKKLYLTKRVNLFGGGSKFNLLGTENIILELSGEKEIITNYGEVKNIFSFPQFVTTYTEFKQSYEANEIIEIFECVKKDYDELIKNDKVKKLELKK